MDLLNAYNCPYGMRLIFFCLLGRTTHAGLDLLNASTVHVHTGCTIARWFIFIKCGVFVFPRWNPCFLTVILILYYFKGYFQINLEVIGQGRRYEAASKQKIYIETFVRVHTEFCSRIN